ncbi:MAG: hypothetical protein R3F65_02175 [bacterium]|nr:hypothetical protein [Myxococcales bacterium]MCB9543092.1 hypothetical protein [Myxococcales bacterium]MCB9551626.1 hypothetical protein [Myxococcales bacterium]
MAAQPTEVMVFGVPTTGGSTGPAEPSDVAGRADPIGFADREDELFDALDESIDDRRVNLRVYETPDLSELVRRLPDAPFAGLHLVAHGLDGGSIAVDFGFGDRRSREVVPVAMEAALADRQLRFAVLNVCNSKPLAEALRAHVDCVIGVDDVLRFETASLFNRPFYEALARGESVGRAFAHARSVVINNPLWANRIELFEREPGAAALVPFPAAEPPPVEGPADVFIIGGERHRRAIRRLKGHLAPATTFSVVVDLGPGMVFDEVAPDQIETARLVIVLVGEKDARGHYEAEDIVRTIERRCGRGRVSFFPVSLPGHDPRRDGMPYGLARVVGVQVPPPADFAAAAAAIRRVLRRLPPR